MSYLRSFQIKGKRIEFPIFLPDATRAVARSLDSQDLKISKIEGIVVNAYHLMLQPGTTVLDSLGGVKKFMNWDGWVVSDSGGFQVLSLIYRNPAFGKISDRGVTFIHSLNSQRKKYFFSPEKSIQKQFEIGADIQICLDDCPRADAKEEGVKLSVKRTIEWAKRCKEEYLKQIEKRKLNDSNRPLIFGVVQGGADKKEREKCAQALLDIGFDGYAFGGWPFDPPTGGEKRFQKEMLEFTAELIPESSPRFALGIGRPQDIAECFKMGYNIFDCVLPTRDARHQRLYLFKGDPETADVFDENTFGNLYIMRERHIRDNRPISEFCDCFTCTNYSKAYLVHLFKIQDSLAGRLASIHNLRVYSKLIEVLRSRC